MDHIGRNIRRLRQPGGEQGGQRCGDGKPADPTPLSRHHGQHRQRSRHQDGGNDDDIGQHVAVPPSRLKKGK